jgi:formate-dependent nitrite reductase cytochrome c552 subunit
VTCHQGRASGAQVTAAVSDRPDDVPDAELSFVNPHYNIAAATNLGGYGALGYQYPGKTYSGRFSHAKPVSSCLSCHNPHSLAIDEKVCLTCHETGVPADIRISRQSYDGSGDTSKGISADIRANSDRLMAMISGYAAQVAQKPIVYDGAHHPYFFADANGDGLVDQVDGEAVVYDAWTPRLLEAAYNWKFVNADPGVHVHNAHYALELLYDSAEDLSGPLNVDMEQTGMAR